MLGMGTPAPKATVAVTAATATVKPTNTVPAPTVTTAAVKPTDTPTPTVTLPAPTQTVTATVSTQTPLPPPAGNVVFEDEFNGDLRDKWRIWGSPLPKIDEGFGDRYLYLIDEGTPGDAGVTTKLEIFNSPGTQIQFVAQLMSDRVDFALILDWHDARIRLGSLLEDGVIHLEILNDNLILAAPITKESCDKPVVGFKQHTYRIRIVDRGGLPGLALFLDDQPEPVCQINSIGLGAIPGRITLSGVGSWVTSVRVTAP
jgi:hypothetical protein